jgi:hypothetical protein
LIVKIEPEPEKIKEVPRLPAAPVIFITDATDSTAFQEITIKPEDMIEESRSV